MPDNRQFFNELAFNWDETSHHDKKKLSKIIQLSNIKSNSNILDVGTGTGVLIEYLLKKNPSKIVGIDIAENMIAIAKKKYVDSKIKFIVEDIMNYNNKGFDYIFLYSVYPHIKDNDKLFQHLAQLLNKNGKVIIAHSQSKEEINKVHSGNEIVKNDRLPNVEITIGKMSKYFKVNNAIDNDQMYYVCGTVIC